MQPAEATHDEDTHKDEAVENVPLTEDEPQKASLESPIEESNTVAEPSPSVTPLPRGQMFALCLVFFCEAYNFTYIFSFLGYMIVDFGLVTDEADSGYYAGIVAATFAGAQFVSGFIYGYLSDKYSKKRVMMFGNLGTSLAVVGFGFSVNFPMAVCFRGLNGALNANIATAKAYLSEMTDTTNQSKGFSLQGLAFNVGAILGPAIGGLLSRPVQKYPTLFEKPALVGLGKFLTLFPYLLPALLSSVLMLVGFFIGWKFLVDKPSAIPQQVDEQALLNNDIELDEKSTIDSPDTNVVEPPKPMNPFKKLVHSFRIVFNKDFCLSCGIYIVIVAVAVMTDETWPLWSMLPLAEGGLNFETTEIGAVQAMCGVMAVMIQLLVFQRCVKWFGKLGTARIGMIAQTLLFVLPQIHLTVQFGKVALWGSLVVFSFVRAFWSSLAFTAVFILISNSAPPGKSGIANGLAHSVANVSRISAPLIAGPLFAWTTRLTFPMHLNIIFAIMVILIVIGVGMSFFLPKTINDPKSELNRVNSGTIISAAEEADSAV